MTSIITTANIQFDEIHTADSSRLWVASTYKERLKNGLEPEKYDKELLRQFLATRNYSGKGPVPNIPKRLKDRLHQAYLKGYETLTGESLQLSPPHPEDIRHAILTHRFIKPFLK